MCGNSFESLQLHSPSNLAFRSQNLVHNLYKSPVTRLAKWLITRMLSVAANQPDLSPDGPLPRHCPVPNWPPTPHPCTNSCTAPLVYVIIHNFAAGLISFLHHAHYNFHPLFLFISLCYLTILAKFLCGHKQCHSTTFTSFWHLTHHSRQCGCY